MHEFGKPFRRMIDLKGRKVSEEMYQAWFVEFRETDQLDWACACDQITMGQNTWPTLGQMHGAVSRARGERLRRVYKKPEHSLTGAETTSEAAGDYIKNIKRLFLPLGDPRRLTPDQAMMNFAHLQQRHGGDLDSLPYSPLAPAEERMLAYKATQKVKAYYGSGGTTEMPGQADLDLLNPKWIQAKQDENPHVTAINPSEVRRIGEEARTA